MQVKRMQAGRTMRRGAVAVYLAISSTVIIGMAALAIDISALYQAQSELQRSTDAAALAAAAELAAGVGIDVEDNAIEAADQLARMNNVFGREVYVQSASDVEFGAVDVDPVSGKYSFSPGGAEPYQAVRVTLRRSDSSSAGAMPMMFARLFGHESKNLEAKAAAVLVPRDIAVVMDLSGSTNYDSQLRWYDRSDGGYSNARDVWAALDGPEPSRPYAPGHPSETEYAGDTGPTFGGMTEWGDYLDSGYDPAADPGLFYIPRYNDCGDGKVESFLASVGYSDDEMALLLASTNDNNKSHYRYRVAVCIGLAEWRSGREGGLHPDSGDGDDWIDSGELSWVPKPSFCASWNWTNYLDSVISGTSNSHFRYRYGLKTFVDFLLDREMRFADTNNLWATPEQPVTATKDALREMRITLEELDSMDHISLEIFGRTSKHEVNMSDDLHAPENTYYQRQSGHYDTWTNIGGGLSEAVAELLSDRARPNAHKIILLMSDGVANTDEYGNFNTSSARAYALEVAQLAADHRMRIYSVSFGFGVDRSIMQEIAAIGKGIEFYAEGTPEEYSDQLKGIFQTLGGKRAVALVE